MELTGKNGAEITEILCTRYGIGKSSVYKRLKLLHLSVKREGGKFYLPATEVQLLDDLDNWIREGNTMETFVKPGMLTNTEESAIDIEALKKILGDGSEEGTQIRELLRRAQEKAAGVLIAQNIIAAEYQNNPELLDEDLREQVEATEEILVSKPIDPKEYALSLVKKCRQQWGIA
jgi:hypothetical protein